MTETKQEAVAFFRYALIHPMLDPECVGKRRTDYTASVEGKEHDIPFSTRRYVREGTLITWLGRYRKYGIEGLKPKKRKDRGESRKIGPELGAEILSVKREHPEMTLAAAVQKVETEKPELCVEPVPMSSVYRFYNGSGAADNGNGDGKDRRRFEMEHCNDCWMLDAMDGPRAVCGNGKEPKKTHCFGIIDDKSRLVCHAEFYPDEKAESLLDCMWKAFNRRGLPRMLFTDNGSAMRDARLKLGCADLEIHLAYSRPYTPQGKAKIISAQFFYPHVSANHRSGNGLKDRRCG
jgi:transposase InsO family protein